MKRKREKRPSKRIRTKEPPIQSTAAACFMSGSNVAEAQMRTLMALDALKMKDKPRFKNELLIASYNMKLAGDATPACKTNKEIFDDLTTRAQSAVDSLNSAEARTLVRQAHGVVRSCEEKVRDRCVPEMIPTASSEKIVRHEQKNSKRE